MQSASQSIKPFLVIGDSDDQGRQRGEIDATENFAPRRKDAEERISFSSSLRLGVFAREIVFSPRPPRPRVKHFPV